MSHLKIGIKGIHSYLTKKMLYMVMLLCLPDLYSAQTTDTVWVNGVPKVYKRKSPEELNPSPLKKDDYLFELSYGYPFVPVREAQTFGINYINDTRNYRITGNTNHICARVDYQLNDEYSTGLEFTYANTQFQYIRQYASGTGSLITSTDSVFNAEVTKIRFLAKMGFHLNISDRLDAYLTAGFGYKQFTYQTRDAYFSSVSVLNEILPVAIRLSFGGRFFLSDNMALHVEGGIGGPLMQIGLSYRMR